MRQDNEEGEPANSAVVVEGVVLPPLHGPRYCRCMIDMGAAEHVVFPEVDEISLQYGQILIPYYQAFVQRNSDICFAVYDVFVCDFGRLVLPAIEEFGHIVSRMGLRSSLRDWLAHCQKIRQ